MAVIFTTKTQRVLHPQNIHCSLKFAKPVALVLARHSSQSSSGVTGSFAIQQDHSKLKDAEHSALARLPTSSILRSLILGSFFTSPLFFRPGFALLKKIATSKSPILNPDRNPILKAIIKPIVYNQFCAGTTKAEIQDTMSNIKSLGFSGVILCYGKEIEIVKPSEAHTAECQKDVTGIDQEILGWKEGNLATLDMISEGDYLGIKYTGSGKAVTEALIQGCEPPKQFVEAIDKIAQKATVRKCRIWIDAEQQVLQPTINRWTVDLMRQHNRDGNALIYNTIQAYLKDSRKTLEEHLNLARKEQWTLAVKLVRGAYIGNDFRDRIHDTKEETDDSYNGIVSDLVAGTFPGCSGPDFPRIQLFLAGHNPESISRAVSLVSDLSKQGKLRTLPEFGQLQGMADELGCKILQHGENETKELGSTAAVPRVYKCLTWGSVQECMQYLVRRVIENRGATDRMKDGMSGLAWELRRRVLSGVMGRTRG